MTATERPTAFETAAMGKAALNIGPPTFDNVEAERAYRKAKLAGALRIFGRLGFGEGVAGHITVRDPESGRLLDVPTGIPAVRERYAAAAAERHARIVAAVPTPVTGTPIGIALLTWAGIREVDSRTRQR